MSNFFRIGMITSAHGIKGAVKVFPTTEDPQRFRLLKTVQFSSSEEEQDMERQFTISQVQFSKNMVIVSFKEVIDRNEAERLRGGSLWIPDEEAVPLKEGEFYIRDWMQAIVKDEDGTVLGKVDDILETGSNLVLVVKEENGKELLIPMIHECILSMDQEKKEINVHLLKGLRS